MDETQRTNTVYSSDDLQYHMLCKLGEAIYMGDKNRERAVKASDAVDYLVEQGVLDV
jgi:hypothetical protein